MWVNIIFLIAGIIFKAGPINKNQIFGYKSSLSQKNDDTWRKANNFMANCFISFGIVTLAAYLICKHANLVDDLFTKNLLAVVISAAASVIATEIYLKVKFKNDGSRKNSLK